MAVIGEGTTFTNGSNETVAAGDVRMAIEEVPTEELEEAQAQLPGGGGWDDADAAGDQADGQRGHSP